MISRLPILALLILAGLPAAQPARGAAAAQRNYTVTSFDRIRIDGPYQVQLRTGVSPFARASGSQAALDGLSLDVQGRTLVVRAGGGSWSGYPGEIRGPVTIEVGTHELGRAWINGAGALSIDKVRGMTFDLDIQGSGIARVDQAEVDRLTVGVNGAGSARVAGRALKLTAALQGTSTFEGDTLRANDAVITAEGPTTVRAEVSGTARVNATGLATVTLTGNPSCTVKAQGSATVSGCK